MSIPLQHKSHVLIQVLLCTPFSLVYLGSGFQCFHNVLFPITLACHTNLPTSCLIVIMRRSRLVLSKCFLLFPHHTRMSSHKFAHRLLDRDHASIPPCAFKVFLSFFFFPSHWLACRHTSLRTGCLIVIMRRSRPVLSKCFFLFLHHTRMSSHKFATGCLIVIMRRSRPVLSKCIFLFPHHTRMSSHKFATGCLIVIMRRSRPLLSKCFFLFPHHTRMSSHKFATGCLIVIMRRSRPLLSECFFFPITLAHSHTR